MDVRQIVLVACQKLRLLSTADKCGGDSGFFFLSDEFNCRGYWRCVYGKGVPSCCPQGYMFDGNNRRCVENPECQDQCSGDTTVNTGRFYFGSD